MEIPEIEKEYSELKEKAYYLRNEWNHKTTFYYKLTHKIEGKKNNVLIMIPIYLLAFILLFSVLNGSIQGGLQGLSMGGEHLENGHIYSSPKGNWAGYNYEMLCHSDTYGSRYYSPVDGTYIGWMSNSEAAVNLTK
jgi:hypothetical protein